MLVDGKAIAGDILVEVKNMVARRAKPAPRLSAITCEPNFETQKYLKMKQEKAASVGIALNVVELPHGTTTEMAAMCLRQVTKQSDGVVVQLPLPSQVDREVVLSLIPVNKDPDGFCYGEVETACLPPVVAAIDEIAKRHNVVWQGKRVVVLGEGRLVGQPAAVYARRRGAEVVVLTKDTYVATALLAADIIISGIGRPHFIISDLVKDNVIIFDAGTSEDGGELAGDCHPAVGEKAALLTPVPGGIGPITIACLLRNLVALTRQ